MKYLFTHAIMRKVIFLWILLFALTQFTYADGIVTYDTKRLPAEAHSLIKRHFPQAQISYIKIEKEFWGIKKYEVLLTDRTEIEFTGEGNWTEIECDDMPVPPVLIPEYIMEYIKSYFPDHHVIKIERKSKEIEVELNNGFSLTFNKKGELIDLDD